MTNAFISGTGFYVPPRVVTNDDLVNVYGIDTSHDWIVQRTGIEARRFADEGVGTSDLAVPAAEMAIEAAGLQKTDLDMIVFATLSPDHAFPGSGVYLQRKLGLCEGSGAKFVPALDVRNQCSGFLYGLACATSMVKSGACKHVLLVGAETHSAALDLSTRGRAVASLFGDGAGAVVVSRSASGMGAIGPAILRSDGSGRSKIVIRQDERLIRMQGLETFKAAVINLSSITLEIADRAAVELEEIGLFVYHQANGRIVSAVADRLGLEQDRVVDVIERYGNTSSGSIPIALTEAQSAGRLGRGDLVLLAAVGAGLVWGGVMLEWH